MMAEGRDPEKMHIFGNAEKHMFREIVKRDPAMAEAWLAFPDDSEDLPPFIEDDDPYIWKRTTWVYGRGESPAEAFSDLVRRVEEITKEEGGR